MRDELVRMVCARTGLDEATARKVTATVVDFLRAQLPPEAAPLLDMVLGDPAAGGAAPGAGGAADTGSPGGLLGELFGPQATTQP